jgi:hypothetical protein
MGSNLATQSKTWTYTVYSHGTDRCRASSSTSPGENESTDEILLASRKRYSAALYHALVSDGWRSWIFDDLSNRPTQWPADVAEHSWAGHSP